MTDALLLNPNRKFIEVEMYVSCGCRCLLMSFGREADTGGWECLPSNRAFFSRWWWDQTEARKTQVRQLVANKQLVFVNGGTNRNEDESCPFTLAVH